MEKVMGWDLKVRKMDSEVDEKIFRINKTDGEPIAAGTLCARLLPAWGAGSPMDELDDGADQSVSYFISGVGKDGSETVFAAHDLITDEVLENLEALHISPFTVAGC